MRDSVGAVYSGFQAPGTLVFDRDGVRFEVVARLVDPAPVTHPDAATKPRKSSDRVGSVPVPK